MTRAWLSLLLLIMAVLLVVAWPRHAAQAEMLAFASPRQSSPSGKPVRVKADLARRIDVWHGKDDCRSPDRARAALTPILSQWLGTRMTERPSRQLAQWGYHSGDIWHEDRVIDGKRQCSGGFRRVIAYADFR
ncbi:hypothetical protein [Sphingomonas sp. 35-24ZXX]|uniref:hypothetical protein n=1 Tax=Sphingomonas sp. 35-24ZXX TaxID=1545915 RepID=UPI00053BDB53|nr:hypothetical protein [Sphingomonas sp. 35-24ZXX]